MHYIALDLEWNQGEEKKVKSTGLLFEIIEIGAVKLDEKMNIVDQFQALITPRVFRKMHSMTQQLTGITMKELRSGIPVEQAMEEFFAWCGEDYRMCTWGDLDLMELQRNLNYFNIENPLEWPLFYYDIQKLYRIRSGKKAEVRSLETAVEELSLKADRKFHRAQDDAWYTARVMQVIDMQKMKQMFSVDYYRLPSKPSEELHLKFDTYNKYVSRAFQTPEQAMKDREVLASRCPVCGRNCKRWIPWFTTHNRNYLCGCTCQEHGWLRGKIRLRKQYDGKIYVVKTVRSSNGEEIEKLFRKQEEIRAKRRKKRHS